MSDSFLPTCSYSIRLLDRLTLLDTQKILDFNLIHKAIYWAKKYHDGQFRKSGEPYYTHPLEVAYMVSEYKLTTNVIVTAVLHDIVEDTQVTVGMIVDAFSWRIAEMVDMLTRDRPDGSKLSVETILNNAYDKDDKEVLLVKVIDRLHNMMTIGAKKVGKRKRTVTQTLEEINIFALYLNEPTIFTKLMLNITEQYPNINTKNYLLNLTKTEFSSNYHLPSLVFQDGFC